MSQNDEDFWKIVEPLGSKRKQRRAARKLRTGRKKPRTSRIAVVVAVVAVLAGAGLAVSWVTDTITRGPRHHARRRCDPEGDTGGKPGVRAV
ncbi:hypothetical protein [Fodinicola feengrottensis]|uniref:hypothetical protein n=1 Tax=Fodinicola feengrottensis TaxID=435914 RepID=UPI0013D317C8|nr:hypothetical protein [Fodinicola feengrottensis]